MGITVYFLGHDPFNHPPPEGHGDEIRLLDEHQHDHLPPKGMFVYIHGHLGVLLSAPAIPYLLTLYHP
jgi:hypothetical protein